MILIDFSSIIHRMIHSSISRIKPAKHNGKYITSQFAGLMKYYILQDLFSVEREHGAKFGEMIICLDKSSGGYWRKDIYAGYKENRKIGRNESDIEFKEVFAEIEGLLHQIRDNLPWKVVEVERAEADDVMLVLAKEYNSIETILIHSPDKDMIQAQKDTDNVFQYSALTKKFLVPENKHENMAEWLNEHICLGDESDDVPRVIDHTIFSDAFIKHIHNMGYDIKDPIEYKNSDISDAEKRKIIEDFDVYIMNKKGESTGKKEVYKKERFGASTLKKEISKFGSLDAWLDSHPSYRKNYERNYKLVMTEGIPSEIRDNIILSYKNSINVYNSKAFSDYLVSNNLTSVLTELPPSFRQEITAEDFNW